MKQMKTWLCLILALLLCLSAAACAADPTPSTGGNIPTVPSFPISGGTTPSETEPPVVIHCQHLPEEVENPDNLPIVKWVCLTPYSLSSQWDETMARQLNQLLAEKGLPFRVQFIVYTSENLKENWFLQPEVQEDLASADLIYGDIDSENGLSFLQPITDAIDDYVLQTAVPHEAYWLKATYDGETYGICSSAQYLVSNGWWVDDKVLNKYGLTQVDFSKPYWEMDSIFASIFEANKQQPFLRYVEDGYTHGNLIQDYNPSALGAVISNHFQLVGSCYAIDYSGDKPVVVNYLDTDYIRNTQAALLRYQKAGYIASQTQPYLIHYSNVFADFPYSYEGITYISTEPVQFSNTDFGGYMIGLSKNAQNKDAALSLLSLIANDSTIRQQLLFGSTEETVGANRFLSFLSPYSSLQNSTTGSFERPAEEGLTQLETHQQILDRSVIQLPIAFDFSAVETETAAVNKILMTAFNSFSQLTEAEYNQMLSDIKAAGGDRIQAELQRQLDEWLKANPDWNK